MTTTPVRLDGDRINAALATAEHPAWYRIDAKAGEPAALYIFDEINPMWGIGAQQVVDQLKTIDASQIDVHINSPGGNVFDGIAIMNALRNHKANVTVKVDGLAASIASVIAMAGDSIVMSLGSQMMVHNPSGFAMGDAKTMRELADTLDKSRASIASIYADRAGGTVDAWGTAMDAETWYTAQEAVDAGLADKVDDSSQAEDIAAKFDLSIFNHAGRAAAPSPYMPPPKTPVSAAEAIHRVHNAAIAAANTPKEGDMQFSDEQLATLRSKLGLADDATLEPSQVLAAIADMTPQEPKNVDPETPVEKPAAKQVAGTMVIDASAWDAQQEAIKRLEAKQAKHDRSERDDVIAKAVRDGKFPPFRKEHYARLWEADPEGTRQVIDGLTKNVIPVEALGMGLEDDESIDAEFAHLFPKGA
jgi:ATP-dependent protease ClpP protease subunit